MSHHFFYLCIHCVLRLFLFAFIEDEFLKPYHDIYGALCADMGEDRANYIGIPPSGETNNSLGVRQEIIETAKEIQPGSLFYI